MEENPKQIEHIVINGGGPLILNIYGAIKRTHELKMWKRENIRSYHGTSAGAIICLMVALNFDWEELDTFIINCPWNNFIKFNVLEIYDYYLKNGITDSALVYGIFTPLFGAKDIDLDITFEQLYEKLNIDLHVYATCFKTFEIKEFNKELTPNVKVLEAIYASTAVPIIFKPIKIDGELYIDGCICLHYPLAKCLEKNIDPQTIMGIKNEYLNDACIVKDDMTIFEYMSKVLTMIFKKTQIEADSNVKIRKEIKVNVTSIDIGSFFEMANSSHLRRLAIENGVNDVNKLHG